MGRRAEGQKGRRAEWQKGRRAERQMGRGAEWHQWGIKAERPKVQNPSSRAGGKFTQSHSSGLLPPLMVPKNDGENHFSHHSPGVPFVRGLKNDGEIHFSHHSPGVQVGRVAYRP